eukprot:SAG31_NODE_6698_length_1919_cov_26.213736_2_plen_108_part_00
MSQMDNIVDAKSRQNGQTNGLDVAYPLHFDRGQSRHGMPQLDNIEYVLNECHGAPSSHPAKTIEPRTQMQTEHMVAIARELVIMLFVAIMRTMYAKAIAHAMPPSAY